MDPYAVEQAAKKVQRKLSGAFNIIQDRAKVAIATFQDDLTKSMVKACNRNLVPPKEKHVRRIIAHSGGRNCNIKDVVEFLSKQMRKSKDWVVAIKSLQVFHRTIQEGHNAFVDTIINLSPGRVLGMAGFSDTSSGAAMDQTPFIRQYASYVEERVLLYRDVSLRRLQPKLTFAELLKEKNTKTNDEFFKVLDCLLKTLGELLNVRLKRSTLSNPASLGAFRLLLQDSFTLYKLTSEGVVRIIDEYNSMGPRDVKKAFDLYQRHYNQSIQLADFFEFAKKIPGIRSDVIPTLKPQPESLLLSMKEFLDHGSVTSFNSQKSQYLNTSQSFKAPADKVAENDEYEDIPTQDLSDILSEQDMKNLQIDDESPSTATSSSVTPTRSNSTISPSKPVQQPVAAPAPVPAPAPAPKQQSVEDFLFDFGDSSAPSQPAQPAQQKAANNGDFMDFFGTPQQPAPAPVQQQPQRPVGIPMGSQYPQNMYQQPQNPFADFGAPQQQQYPPQYMPPQQQYPPQYGYPQQPQMQAQQQSYYNPYAAQQQYQATQQQQKPGQRQSLNPFDY